MPIPLAPLYVAPNFAGTAAAVAQRGQLRPAQLMLLPRMEWLLCSHPHRTMPANEASLELLLMCGRVKVCYFGQPL